MKNQGGEREKKNHQRRNEGPLTTCTNMNGGDANMIRTSPLKLVFGRLATPHMLTPVTHSHPFIIFLYVKLQ